MKDGNNTNEKETEYLSSQERNKLLWRGVTLPGQELKFLKV